jgi:hypothetical protein
VGDIALLGDRDLIEAILGALGDHPAP